MSDDAEVLWSTVPEGLEARFVILERLPGEAVRLALSDADDLEVTAVLGHEQARSLALALLEATR